LATRNPHLLLKPEKKATAKLRHKRVSVEFEAWLKKNPKATHAEIFKAFDLYCDSAYLDERVNGKPNPKS
jgi:hypothetical protein